MLTMPRSTPRKPSGSCSAAASGTSTGGVQEPHAVPLHQVGLALAVRGQLGQLLRRAGERHALEPASVVQIDTVRARDCQDSIRSSYGCAASGRNAIGFSAARRSLRAGPAEVSGPRFAFSVVYASQVFLMTCWAACAPSPHRP